MKDYFDHVKQTRNPFTNNLGMTPGVEQLAKEGVKITGLPEGHQGVEMKGKAMLQAQLDQGPMRPMVVNGAPMFKAPPMAPSAPAGPMAPAADPPRRMYTGPAPVVGGWLGGPMNPPNGRTDPLGGVSDVSPLSNSGPMAYSERGAGTNNPNAYKVGQNNRSRGERMLMTIARKGGSAGAYAASQVADLEEARRNPGGGITLHDMFMAHLQQQRDEAAARRAEVLREDERSYQTERDRQNQEQQQANRQQDRQWQIEDRTAAEAAANRPDVIEERPINGGRQTAILRNKKIFNIVNTEQPVPQMNQDDVHAVQAQGGEVTMRQGDTTMRFPAKSEAPTAPPEGIQYEKDPTGKITGAVFPMFNPATGQWGLQRLDLNGDGKVSPAEAAAAGAAQPQVPAAKPKALPSGSGVRRL